MNYNLCNNREIIMNKEEIEEKLDKISNTSLEDIQNHFSEVLKISRIFSEIEEFYSLYIIISIINQQRKEEKNDQI